MNQQRIIMYGQRMKVLRGENVHEQVLKYIPDYVESTVRAAVNTDVEPSKWNVDDLNRALEQRLLPEGTNYVTQEKLDKWDYDVAIKHITKRTEKAYEEKIASLQKETGINFGDVERQILLRNVDRNWIDHIDAMDQLRKGIVLRAYGQTDPVIAYKQEGSAMFNEMIERIQTNTVAMLLKVRIEVQPEPRRPASCPRRPALRPVARSPRQRMLPPQRHKGPRQTKRLLRHPCRMRPPRPRSLQLPLRLIFPGSRLRQASPTYPCRRRRRQLEDERGEQVQSRLHAQAQEDRSQRSLPLRQRAQVQEVPRQAVMPRPARDH